MVKMPSASQEWFDDLNVPKISDFNENLHVLKNCNLKKIHIDLLEKLPINSQITDASIDNYDVTLVENINDNHSYVIKKDNVIIDKFIDNKFNQRIINNDTILSGSKNDFSFDKIINLKSAVWPNFLKIKKYEWSIEDLNKIHALDMAAQLR